MTNYVNELNKLINFGISLNEDLTIEDRRNRIKEFRETLSYEKYSKLFNELENYILDNEIASDEKEKVIFLVLEFIRSFTRLEDNIDLFPNNIKILYNSFNEYNAIYILFEYIYYNDVCMVADYLNIVERYLSFLENPIHELFIHECYSRITILTESMINYLDKTDFNGVKHRDTINNHELENRLKEKLDNLNNSRN